MALPWLEAMTPLARAAGGAKAPTRMAFLYVPNGMNMEHWTPSRTGASFELPRLLKPVEAYRQKMLVMSGLAQHQAHALGDGGGDHARGLSVFLTGAHPVKTDGAEIKVGMSVDQVAAQAIGHETRFSSLELGIDPSAQAGSCDSGYSCAYSSNISWRSPTTPAAKEINPRLVFERLFGEADEPADDLRRRKHEKSILDFVAEDARRLQARLGANDRRKVDEYTTAVREIERRLTMAENKKSEAVERPDVPKPEGVPKDNQEHIRLMLDMLALAFQTDQTRVATFVFANEGSNKSYNWIDVPEGHHDISHHQRNAEKLEKIAKINAYYVEHLAYFLGKLEGVREGDETLLDHSMILYGSGIGDGDRHNHNDLPIALFGSGGGTIKTGRHVEYERNTPLNNLFLSMLDRMGGTRAEGLGDSNGRLGNLDG